MEAFAKRRRHVEEHLSEDIDLLKQHEDVLRFEDDPRRRAGLKNRIKELKDSIEAYRAELTSVEPRAVGPRQPRGTDSSSHMFHAEPAFDPSQDDRMQLGTSDLPVLATPTPLAHPRQTLSLADDLLTTHAPPPPENFVGYDEIISDVMEALGESAMFVMTGVLGVGKTTLLRKLAAGIDRASIFWYECSPGLTSLDDVLRRLARFFDARSERPVFARAINSPELSTPDKVRLLVGELSRNGGHLFFDRVEAIEGDTTLEGFLTALKEQGGKGRVFLGSRSRPSFVKPLDEAKGVVRVIALTGLSDGEVVEYFERKGIRISGEGAQRLNRVFDGLPLALELLTALAGEEASEPELIARADGVREQVVEQLFEEMYLRLSPAERDLLTTAALFKLPFEKERLLGAHRALFDRNAAADFIVLRRYCLTSDGASGYHQLHEVVGAMALSNAGSDLKASRLKLADHLLTDSPDDYMAHLEALLLFRAAENWERAAEVAGELIDRRFVPYEPETAEKVLGLFTEESVSRERWMWLLGDKGVVAEHLRRFDDAEEYLSSMLKLAGEIGSKHAESLALQRLGVLYNAKDDDVRSEEHYRRSLELKMELGDEEGQAEIHNNLGSIYTDRRDFDKARDELEKGLELRRRIDSPGWTYLALHSNLGILYAKQERWEEAFEHSTKALHIAEESRSPYEIAKSLYNLGKHEHERGNRDAAREKYLSVQETAERYDIDELEELASVSLGRLYDEDGEYDSAVAQFERAAGVYERFDQKAPLAAVYFDIGTLHQHKGDHAAALAWYLKGVELFEHFADDHRIELYLKNVRIMAGKLDDETQVRRLVRSLISLKRRLAEQGASFALARVYGALGDIYLDDLGVERVAVCCLRREIELLAELGRDQEQLKAKLELGGTFEAAGRYADALDITDEALELAGSLDAGDLLRVLLYNRGNYYAELELYEQAEESFRRAESHALEADDHKLLPTIRHNLGEVLRRQGRTDEAVGLLDEVLTRARQGDDHRGIVRTLNNLGLAYEEMDQDAEALSRWHEAVSVSRLHSLKRDEANTLISIGNFYSERDQTEEAKGYYEQALSAARESDDIDMEEACILSLAYAHRKLGTFTDMEGEFTKAAERANEMGHHDNLIEFLTIAGEVNLDESESEASAEMFEQALLLAFWREVDLNQQFAGRPENPNAGAGAGHVFRRILASVERSIEAGEEAESRKVIELLIDKLRERKYFGSGFPINLLASMAAYFTASPNCSISEYVVGELKTQPERDEALIDSV